MSLGVLVVGLCTFAPCDEPVTLKEVNVALPRTVADIVFKSKMEFDQKELGYSVSYQSKMCNFTLFVYDLGQKDIPNGKDNKPVQGQLERSINDLKTLEKSGTFQNVQSMKGELPLPKSARDTFAMAGFTFDIEGKGCKSYILLVGRDNHFIKVRLTQYVVDGKTNDAEVEAFLNALVKALTKTP
jgi:hypothetical protein